MEKFDRSNYPNSPHTTAFGAGGVTGAGGERGENVVQRLRRRIRDAKKMGFRVRSDWLSEQQASWCEIGGVKTLFIDLSQTAAEQLRQLDESLVLYSQQLAAGDPQNRQAA